MNKIDTDINTTEGKEQINTDLIKVLDDSNKKLCKVLFELWKIDNQTLKKLIHAQQKYNEKGLIVDIRELIINPKIIEKRSQLNFYLRKAKLKNRLWELLQNHWILTEEKLWEVIKYQILEKQKWNSITFWEAVIEKGYMTLEELTEFLKNNHFKLNKSEQDLQEDKDDKVRNILQEKKEIVQESTEIEENTITFIDYLVNKNLVPRFSIDSILDWKDMSDIDLWKELIRRKLIWESEFSDAMHESHWEIYITSNIPFQEEVTEDEELEQLWKNNIFKHDYISYRN